MHCNEYTLPNGLRIIHEPTLSKVAYCGFAIDAGTRDEAENEQGMAHFVEHLIFKGTEKRKAWHILNRMENVGGDLNAYTNKEETFLVNRSCCGVFAQRMFYRLPAGFTNRGIWCFLFRDNMNSKESSAW